MGNQTHKETTANVDTLNVHQCLAALVLEVFCICMQHMLWSVRFFIFVTANRVFALSTLTSIPRRCMENTEYYSVQPKSKLHVRVDARGSILRDQSQPLITHARRPQKALVLNVASVTDWFISSAVRPSATWRGREESDTRDSCLLT